LTIPGVDVGTAAAVIAAVGDITRFHSLGQLVAYLGLDPKVRQSGSEPARYGHISKRGDPQARSMLVEAAWISIRSPGPLKAFGERVRARRGAQIAAVAVARKLVVLCWHLLTKDQDYAFARPSLTRQKTRRLELLAGSAAATPPRRATRQPDQQPARSRARAASPGRARLPAPHRRLAHNGTKGWCGCDTGARIQQALEGQSRAAGHKPLTPALRYVSHPHHDKSFHSGAPGATPPPMLAPAPRHARRHRKGQYPVQTICTALRALCHRCAARARPRASNSTLSNPEEMFAQPLTFHPQMHKVRALCDGCVSKSVAVLGRSRSSTM
jgi:Transposase IS116/IS110/IS902 family